MTRRPRYRDEQGRFTKDSGERFEVTVWNLIEGDVVAKLWRATEEEVAQMEERYRDEPGHDVQVEPVSTAAE